MRRILLLAACCVWSALCEEHASAVLGEDAADTGSFQVWDLRKAVVQALSRAGAAGGYEDEGQPEATPPVAQEDTREAEEDESPGMSLVPRPPTEDDNTEAEEDESPGMSLVPRPPTEGEASSTPPAESSDSEEGNSTAPGSSSPLRRVNCLPRTPLVSEDGTEEENSVQMVNASWVQASLRPWANLSAAARSSQQASHRGPCTLLLFYAPWCPWSCAAAPYFNAAARLFPGLTLAAVDAWRQQALNTQLGVVAVPTLLLLHDGRPAARFNASAFSLEALAAFVERHTGTVPQGGALGIQERDHQGPLPSRPTAPHDPWLWLSCLFLAACAVAALLSSSLWSRIKDTLRTAWHEAQAQRQDHLDAPQHPHAD